MQEIVRFVKLKANAKTPTQAKEGDAGYDLFAAESYVIRPFERVVVSTGISIEIPYGYYGRVAPRSGLAVKKGIDVLAGVIDAGYRDEVGVVLINLNVHDFLISVLSASSQAKAYTSLFGQPGEFSVKPGDKIAQLIIEPCLQVDWRETDKLTDSERGMGGFGSSGANG